MAKRTKTSEQTNRRTLTGLLMFLFVQAWRKKKWILLPLWILLISLALIILLTGNSSILPAIYIIGF